MTGVEQTQQRCSILRAPLEVRQHGPLFGRWPRTGTRVQSAPHASQVQTSRSEAELQPFRQPSWDDPRRRRRVHVESQVVQV
ncbi:hypothetical protein C5C17_11740 [Pseudoclavibacter sp. RFBA6]|nr:hypothetical protein C5C17_11740 [Pseudoclavibacter sp. RFBA6]